MNVDMSYGEQSSTLQSNILTLFSYRLSLVLDPFTHIEDLSNEIFYEIFEYMECIHLFKAFSNLNNRIENLLHYSFLSLKINIDFISESEVRNYYKQFVFPNKHRIVSIYLNVRSSTSVWSPLFIIDSTFHRLESLILNQVHHKQFNLFFPLLSSLPRLFSIIIHHNEDSIAELTEVYRLLFLLTVLKKLELSAKGHSLIISLPLNTSEQYSHIKRLIINHACNLKELIVLLSYTPFLAHLKCMEISKQDSYNLKDMPLKMLNLISVIFNMCNAQFDALEIFIEKICKQLRVLYINTSQDAIYMDPNRWEQLIVQYIPYLHVFKFEYHEYHYLNIELTSYHNLLAQFTSSFWINRGWVFQIKADIDYWPPIKIIYSVSPEKYLNQMDEHTINMKLIINRLYFAASRQDLVDTIFSFISKFQITHLDIDCQKMIYSKFIKLLSILPNVNFLGILSLSCFKLKCLSQEETEFVQSWTQNNKITKLKLKSFSAETDLQKVQFFIDHCPRMEYLELKCENNFNMEMIIRSVLMKNINKFLYFNSFCLWVLLANNNMIKQLEEIINLEKFIDDYKITCTSEKIYLKWKLK